MSRPQTQNAVLLAFLATTLLLVPMVQGATPTVSPAHESSLRQDQGAAAPYGPWNRLPETVTLFLHRDQMIGNLTDTPSASVTNLGSLAAGSDSPYYLDYERPRDPVPGRVYDETMDAGARDVVLYDLNHPHDRKIRTGTTNVNPSVGDPLPPLQPLASYNTGPAHWVLPVGLMPTQDFEIYNVEAEIYATCLTNAGTSGSSTSVPGAGLALTVWFERYDKQADGSWLRRDHNGASSGTPGWKSLSLTSTSFTDGVTRFVTSTTDPSQVVGNPFAESGEEFDSEKHRLGISIDPPATGQCFIHFDSADFPSNVKIQADTGRISSWIESTSGQPIEGLAKPATSSAEKRNFLVQVAHVSAWPKFNHYENPRAGGPSATNYMDDFWDQSDPSPALLRSTVPMQPNENPNLPGGNSQGDTDRRNHIRENPVAASTMDMRIRNLDTTLIATGTSATTINRVPNTRQVFDVGDSINRVQYQLFYPGSLPEVNYQIEVFTDLWGVARSNTFVAGLKGFALQTVGSAIHEVNAGEPTEFLMRLRNVGADGDTAQLSVSPPGDNWQAEVIGGSQFLNGDGGEVTLVVRVVPPATALAGINKTIRVTATSALFSAEIPAVSQDVEVRIVAAKVPGVDVTSPLSIIEVEPGQQVSLAGMRVTNTGTFGETYLLSTRVPTSNSDWTATVPVPSKFIPAASPTDFPVTVKVPPTARDGQSVPVTISATSLSNAAVIDNVTVTFVVRSLAGMILSVTPNTQLRTQDHCTFPNNLGGQACVDDAVRAASTAQSSRGFLNDPDADTSALMRITFTNPSLVPDTYTVIGSFPDPSSTGGWSARFGNATVPNNAPSGTSTNTRITVPGQTTQYFYLEMGYNPSWRDQATEVLGSDPASSQTYTLNFRSTNDPGVQKAVTIGVSRTSTFNQVTGATHANSVHNVTVETDITDVSTLDRVSAGQTGEHLFRVINRANERDTIVVAVTGAPTSGFTRTLQLVGTVPSLNTCSADLTGLKFTCPMGVNDEALFRLNSTPSASTPVGAADAAGIVAVSGDNGARLDALAFVTEVVGNFQFAAIELDATRDIERGRSSPLPFVIRNVGSAADTYTISMLSGDGNWQPRFSTGVTQFVPAGRDVAGFLVLTAPADAPIGVPQIFRVAVTSNGTGQTEVMDFTATARAPSTLSVAGTPLNEILLPQRGVSTPITVRVTDTGPQAAGRNVTVAVDPTALPLGWSVNAACPTRVNDLTCTTTLNSLGTSDLTFNVTAPATALSTTRANLHFTATSATPSNLTGFGDVFLQLADVFGIDLELLSQNQTIVPGGEVVHLLRVNNTGLGQTTVSLTNTPVPAGWFVQYNPANITLGPLESRVIQVLVRAPLGANPATSVPITIVAASGSPPATDQVQLFTTVGFFKLELDARPVATVVQRLVNGTGNATGNGTGNATGNGTGNGTQTFVNETVMLPRDLTQPVPRVSPSEGGDYVVRIFNNGTLPDEVRPFITVRSANGQGLVTMAATPASAILLPGEGVDFAIHLALSDLVPSDQDIVVNATFRSLRDPMTPPTEVGQDLTIHVLRHAKLDADFDGNTEFAIDRNEDPADGFEQFQESSASGGRTSRVANLERFLADSARAKFNANVTLPNNTTIQVFRYGIDGDKDGRTDYFLDHNGDDLPDVYWDPDAGRSQELKTLKDVNRDQIPEYFLDLVGGGEFTDVFDIRHGNFTQLLRRDVDGDGKSDYIVDADHDGVIDDSELILYSLNGRLNSILKLDIDGDGRADEIHDVDGDDAPDFFYPYGEETPVEIVMEDIDGDGVADWTFDLDGDGRRETYYNPVTGETAFIDGPQRFMDQLRDYWWVGAAFALVLVLFVVLLFVTRR